MVCQHAALTFLPTLVKQADRCLTTAWMGVLGAPHRVLVQQRSSHLHPFRVHSAKTVMIALTALRRVPMALQARRRVRLKAIGPVHQTFNQEDLQDHLAVKVDGVVVGPHSTLQHTVNLVEATVAAVGHMAVPPVVVAPLADLVMDHGKMENMFQALQIHA